MANLTDSAKTEAHLCVSAATATQIAKRIRLAEIYLRNLKGDTWYADLVALGGTDPGDGSLLRAEEAESLVAFYFALPHLNLRIDEDGGILLQEWTDDGQGGRLQKAFAGARTLEAVRAELLSQAKCLIYGDVTIEYSIEESTLISAVGEASPLSGLFMTAIVED